MAQGDEANSGIFRDMQVLLESLESNEDKIFKMTDLLDQKRRYYEQLVTRDNELNVCVAKKRAKVSFIKDMDVSSNAEVGKFRSRSEKIYEACSSAYQDINDIEGSFCEHEDKANRFEKLVKREGQIYKKKLDDLTTLLEQLQDKRKKKLETLESQENRIKNENSDLRSQLVTFDTVEDFLYNSDDDKEQEIIEMEFKELHSKLTVLNEEYLGLNEECNASQAALAELSNTFGDEEFEVYEKRALAMTSEVSELTQKIDTLKTTDSDLLKNMEALEAYEKQLNDEFEKASSYLECLDQNGFGGFSNIEQELDKIRADIAERHEKYSMGEMEKVQVQESIAQKNKEIEEINSEIKKLSDEYAEIDALLRNTKSFDYASEAQELLKELEQEKTKKENLETEVSQKQDEICEIETTLEKEKEKNELEIMAMENTHQMDMKKIEKGCSELEDTKNTLLEDAKLLEAEMQELEAKKKTLQENLTLQKTLDEKKAKLKSLTVKIEELRKKNVVTPAPPPIYVPTTSPSFAKPKTTETIKKKIAEPKIIAQKKPKNWDSDSSVEVEAEKFTDFLARKSKKSKKF